MASRIDYQAGEQNECKVREFKPTTSLDKFECMQGRLYVKAPPGRVLFLSLFSAQSVSLYQAVTRAIVLYVSP